MNSGFPLRMRMRLLAHLFGPYKGILAKRRRADLRPQFFDPERAGRYRCGRKDDMFVFDVGADNKLSNQKRFSFIIDGVKCGPDGVRCDVNGNVWASSNAGRAVEYSGVTVWTPDGKLMGRIRLPEVCGNICFGGPKRNRFMAAEKASRRIFSTRNQNQARYPGPYGRTAGIRNAARGRRAGLRLAIRPEPASPSAAA
jgi:hypothetical protein